MSRDRKADDGPLDTAADEQTPVPQSPDELAAFVRDTMGAQVASGALIKGNDGPLAYLVHAFFEGRFVLRSDGTWSDLGLSGEGRPPGDAVVWANRGGGKTFLGAVATALDLIFKKGIEVRILGGSAEQSRRMHDHLRRIFEAERLEGVLEGRTTESRVRLKNGSRVEILAHSERSVRGVRVQKLRCDEVDLFDPDLWQAAQLVTRSASPIPGPWGNEVRGVVEVLSTMHVPMGTMHKIVGESARIEGWLPPSPPSPGSAGEGRGEGALPSPPYPDSPSRVLFKWGVVDSLEHCGSSHICDGCLLKEECDGRAKLRTAGGHMTIHDALTLKRRVSRAVWETEMLCREPSRSDCVFPEFSAPLHVAPGEPDLADRHGGIVVAGMDFGVRCPTVVLWAHLRDDGTLHVVDEYAQTQRTLADHIAAIKARRWGDPAWIAIDPAGQARNEQTGQSNARVMRHMHLNVRARRGSIASGIEAVRAMLAPASGPPRLTVAAGCVGLIDALTRYHYPPNTTGDTPPEKDGSDHWCDALRYLVVNLDERRLAVGSH